MVPTRVQLEFFNWSNQSILLVVVVCFVVLSSGTPLVPFLLSGTLYYTSLLLLGKKYLWAIISYNFISLPEIIEWIMVDVERQRLNNGTTRPKPLPARHPINLLYRSVVIGGSLYGLHTMSVFHAIMRSPDVNHQWFKLGLAGSIGEFLCLTLLTTGTWFSAELLTTLLMKSKDQKDSLTSIYKIWIHFCW